MFSTQRKSMRQDKFSKRDATVQVRMTDTERNALDDWRRAEPDIPTRPEAIREAIRRLVAKSSAPPHATGFLGGVR
jgi:hypothetical protein